MPSDPQSPPIGTIEVYETHGKHWLRVLDEMGTPLLLAGPYSRLADTLGAIARLRDSSASWRPRMTASGEFYFSVIDMAGEVLATSTMYVAPSDRDVAQAEAERVMPAALLVALAASSTPRG